MGYRHVYTSSEYIQDSKLTDKRRLIIKLELRNGSGHALLVIGVDIAATQFTTQQQISLSEGNNEL